MKLSLALASLALISAPVFAQAMTADPMTVTCADMMKMDSKGMMDTGMAVKGALKDDAMVAAMTDEAATMAAEEACKANPDATVIDAMKMPKM